MSFLTTKAGPSHLNNSLHHDRTLATASQYNTSSQRQSDLFRSGEDKVHDHNQEFDVFTGQSSSSSSSKGLVSSRLSNEIGLHEQYEQLLLSSMSPMDGSEVVAFLNGPTGLYDDEVYGDDLDPGSMSYQSYQHKVDHQHSLAEMESQRQRKMEEWILTDDIIAYIEKYDSTYVDDIYGLPPIIEKLIKEAKEELKQNSNDGQQTAVNRLQMIRNHLIGQSQGNRTLAVQQGLQMKTEDWASLF
ncbi:uncharacterized protein BX664DRAFT_329572 [Halteromyces radiatus]|uniref:uncharacterized protein n=1 Tax=Halteromyces radiatus TaxID=101107 RepID=UPI00221FC5B6|nr:uncharacterized protein BX664DRAFT_329572 [Halteromyces radiatus]KAI8093383.1 hypothetical protein BX664DRAFT_329572 [Halteromyces radiatus]